MMALITSDCGFNQVEPLVPGSARAAELADSVRFPAYASQVRHGLQLQSPGRVPAAAVGLHVFGQQLANRPTAAIIPMESPYRGCELT